MPRQALTSATCPASFHEHDIPSCNEATWLWVIGREDESAAINPFVEFAIDEAAIWRKHRDAIIAEWHKEHPGTKPPIQRRLEKQRKYRVGRD